MLAGCWQNNSQAALCQSGRSSPEYRRAEKDGVNPTMSIFYEFGSIFSLISSFILCVYLECIALVAFGHFQYECSQHVESLAVAHSLIPAGVGEQHPLQDHPVLLPLLATVRTAARPVQVLDIRGKYSVDYFFTSQCVIRINQISFHRFGTERVMRRQMQRGRWTDFCPVESRGHHDVSMMLTHSHVKISSTLLFRVKSADILYFISRIHLYTLNRINDGYCFHHWEHWLLCEITWVCCWNETWLLLGQIGLSTVSPIFSDHIRLLKLDLNLF